MFLEEDFKELVMKANYRRKERWTLSKKSMENLGEWKRWKLLIPLQVYLVNKQTNKILKTDFIVLNWEQCLHLGNQRKKKSGNWGERKQDTLILFAW